VKRAWHDKPVGTVDVVPTILDAVGLPGAANGIAGESLMPSATGRKPLENQAVFGEVYPGDASELGNPAGEVAYRWVRDGRLKLIVPHRHGGESPWGDYLDKTALYDVVADPGEQTDLSGDPQYADQLERLRRLLDAWWPVDAP